MTIKSPRKTPFRFHQISRVKPLKRARYGYSTKRKFKRTFGNHEYIRVGQYRVKSIVQQIRDRYHHNGYNALIVPSSKNYQLWVRKRET